MAEFKLGRIRFIWKGAWGSTTSYLIDDVIRYGGRTYICVISHTSGTFTTDLAASRWQLMSDGQEYSGDWTTNYVYKPNDVVKYGGLLYIANLGHTSAATTTLGLEQDAAKWDLFSEGFDYKSDWSVSTRYKVNDLVKYGAYIYTCLTHHTSAATTTLGLEQDAGKWEVFSKGFNWLDTWNVSTRYLIGDVVRYGGQLYVANQGHTSNASATLLAGGLEADQSKWDYLHKGIEYKTDWSATTRYKINDVVKWGSSLWICTNFHVSTTTLTADQANWTVFLPGLQFEDSWNSATDYQIGDFVTYGGYAYVAKTNSLNKNPNTFEGTDWDLFITGFNLVGDYNNATAYKTGDVVRLGGFTYICIDDSTGNRPPNATYWDKLNEGIYWKGNWTNATLYDKGDTVRGVINTNNSYICILGHTSNNAGPATITQPDYPPGVGVDTGTYWQLLSGGAESTALTTQGDLLIYGPSGPVRLPIGQPGQVLTVDESGNLPEWKNFGAINNVWYVATSGVDVPNPAAGSSLNRPWKTIQYALKEIDKGPLYPDAKSLLLRNKAFVQRETIAYINNTFQTTCTNTTTATNLITCASTANLRVGMRVEFTGTTFGGVSTVTEYYIITKTSTQISVSLTPAGSAVALSTASGSMVVKLKYDATKCQRDLGQILDAVHWDLGHGGNERSRLAAVSYYTGSGSYVYGQENETSAAIEFAKIVIDAAISNNTGYPALQGVVSQVVDTDLVEEADAQGIIDSLMDIVIDAIIAGDIDDVPREIIANNTVFVKTGIHYEILPLRVRESTTVVGDELRSTNIQPAPSYVDAADTPYTLQGIDRLKNIIDDIITNTPIVATAAGYLKTVTTPTADVNRSAGTYTGVAVTGGSGSSATVNATVNGSGVITAFSINNSGTGYTVGNTLTIGSGLLGGSSLATTFTVSTVGAGNTITQNVNAPAGSAPAAAAAVSIVDDIYDYINYNVIGDSSSPEPIMSGSNLPQTAIGYTDAVLRLIENKEFLATEVVEYNKKTNPGAFLTYFTAEYELKCKRDVREYVDAVAHDLIYTGNYKALVAAKYYETAVSGSLASDMFYMRNGTGLRNCTLQGLTGSLGAANVYGTQRPTAGAYVSLDPGWGPAHEDVWITNKSPYVQNVSTFGTGCVGLKVDGALHNGGNDSVVANDFTQILSDGIGFWVTNLGRSELVSVFSYYNHIGYLAENGGKVRATNGNNSYGKFGSVSEGGDVSETPITCVVDNKSTDATIGFTFTNGSKILAFEYNNAGTNYTTNAQITVSGDGFGITGLTPVIQNGALYHVRMLETVTSPTSNFGGEDYNNGSNVSQGGTDQLITISNTDTSLASQMTGLSIYIIAGMGAGQYGYVVGFNAGNKNTKVARPSFTHLVITAATAATDEFTCADTSTLEVGMPILFAGTAFGGVTTTATNPTTYYIDTIASNGIEFTISTSPGGATYDIPFDGVGTMELHKAGFDHVVNTICTNTTTSTDVITCASTTALTAGTGVQFDGAVFGGINRYTQYYVLAGATATTFKVSLTVGGTAVTLSTASGTMTVRSVEPILDQTTQYEYSPRLIVSAPPSGVRAICRAQVTTGKISAIRILEPGSGYVSAPTITIVDPSNTVEAPYQTYIGNGALGQPTFTNRGTNFSAAISTVSEIGVTRTVSNITNASPPLVTTTTAHTYSNGQKVTFTDVLGMFEINNGIFYYVKYVSANTFELYVDLALSIPFDTTSFTTYLSAGTVTEFGGFRNSLQSGKFIQVEGLSAIPQAGSNVEFASIPGEYFRLVSVQDLLGTAYPYTALLQVSPALTISQAPTHGDAVSIKIRYSQIRLTGHDFLDIGTGNFTTTNYPGLPLNPPNSDNETVESGGGRVFYTSTDQDGNFRVGSLFSVEQSTGVATLNADAFNISGLQELSLGELTLGGSTASINEFSTDGTMAANSDQIVPTQRAIRTYIASQIGGGASSLNVNQITAGLITIFSNVMETTTGVAINMKAPVNFTGGIKGSPLALGFYFRG